MKSSTPFKKYGMQALFALMLITLLCSFSTTGATKADEGFDLFKMLGRFHPMILHFPIGLLNGLLFLEVYAYFRPTKNVQTASWIILILGTVTAIVATLFGLFLSWEGGYEPEALDDHKWQGIGVTVLAVIACFFKWKLKSQETKMYKNGYNFSLALCVLVMMSAGHLGANLTHGETYIFEHMPKSIKCMFIECDDGTGDKNSSPKEFTEVREIFAKHCDDCHGATKQKGALRLDQLEIYHTMKGDTGRLAFVPYKAMESEVVRVITLPQSHDEVMPPNKKPRLTSDQIMKVIDWVNNGADYASVVKKETVVPAEAPKQLDSKNEKKGTFESEVWPILKEKCVKCHGSKKVKGRLRLDTADWIKKGVVKKDGTTEAVYKAGDADNSPLYKLTTLPEDDDDVMPPKGELLTKEEQKILKDWINNGAKFEGWKSESESSDDKMEEASSDKINFTKQIWPILKESCVKCHGEKKQKGKLRLDSPTWIKKGVVKSDGSSEAVVVAGKPEDSSLYTLTILTEEDDDVMPPKGKLLSKEQTDLIKKWIEQGATYDGWKKGASTEDGTSEVGKTELVDALAKGMEEAPAFALASLNKLGALAMPLANNNNLIQVNFQSIKAQTNDETLKSLKPLKNHLTWLNLSGSQVTSEGLASLSDYSKLTRLNLSNTQVDDVAIVHIKGLTHLQYLNLYGTQVTDAGLKSLSGLKNLKALYLWQSKATKEGAASLKQSIPALYVNLGWENKVTNIKKEEKNDEKKDDSKTAGVSFKNKVLPILKEMCVKCHGDKKQKGGLRLDSADWIKKGVVKKDGSSEVVYIAGNADKSSLYTLTTLSEDHDDVMPPKGKLLTKEQQKVLKDWINAGAKFDK